jgi:regulator of sirC expression with transglutaminase-like and TPR domain
MLRNLKDIHKTQEDWQRLIAVIDRLIVLHPDAWSEYRDRGLAWAVLGHADRAMADLEKYLVQARDALDLDAVAERLAQLRHQNN